MSFTSKIVFLLKRKRYFSIDFKKSTPNLHINKMLPKYFEATIALPKSISKVIL
jgi:hypothetical protein